MAQLVTQPAANSVAPRRHDNGARWPSGIDDRFARLVAVRIVLSLNIHVDARLGLMLTAENVHYGKDDDPHGIDKVPIP